MNSLNTFVFYNPSVKSKKPQEKEVCGFCPTHPLGSSVCFFSHTTLTYGLEVLC